MGETIRAVIWLSDLRGFTSLSESLPRDELIELLNQYFGPMCNAVEANGGEVLKFIGDAMLAIFPVEDDAVAASRNALGAVRVAKAAVNKENERRGSASRPRIRYGLALHVGDVMYGNIGGDARLDFTVIGPAVNLTSRIESMCKNPTLVSTDQPFSRDIRHLVEYRTDDSGAFRLIDWDGLKDHFVEVILVPVKAITEIVGPLNNLPTCGIEPRPGNAD